MQGLDLRTLVTQTTGFLFLASMQEKGHAVVEASKEGSPVESDPAGWFVSTADAVP
jgi:hypothetical protein